MSTSADNSSAEPTSAGESAMPMPSFVRDVRLDVAAALGRRPAWHHPLWLPFASAGIRAALCYRLASACRRHHLTVFAPLFKRLAQLTTGAEISPAAQIGPGLRLPHPTGVVIGPSVRMLGRNTVFHQVTIGARRADAGPDDGPLLERETYCYAGCKVLGNITIGARSQIGPNCVVFKTLSEGSTVLPPEPIVFDGLSFSLRSTKTVEPADPIPDSEPVT